MRYRKLKGTRLFDGERFIENGLLVCREDGTIENISTASAEDDVENVKGILMPGMLNCHCHIELSHLKGKVSPGKGLVSFLMEVVKQRKEPAPDKEEKIAAAMAEMHTAGIVAVGDICNTTDAVALKKKSPLHWQSFIEIINLQDASAELQVSKCNAVLDAHVYHKLPAVLVPHAPYTISPATFDLINAETAGQIISIHNQETTAEDELFRKGTGDFLKLFAAVGNGQSPFAVKGQSSLQTWLPYFTNGQTILLVHNTYITEEDILFAKEYAAAKNVKLVYCLCPNANQYIEGQLPPVDLLLKHNCTIVLGTDSYSSNWQLSIAAEIKCLLENLPHLSLETLLQWATGNAADVWGFEKVGRFTSGTKPGIVLLNEKTFDSQRLL